MTQDGLHITIGSTPYIADQGDASKLIFQNDVQMTKAALLYADAATLCSVTSAALIEIAALPNVAPEKRLGYLEELLSWMGDDEDAKQLTALMELIDLLGYPASAGLIERALAEAWGDAKQFIDETVRDCGGAGILRAVESGLLKVHRFDASLRRSIQDAEHRKFAIEYIAVVSTSLNDTRTFPLFDEDTSEVISTGIDAGLFAASDAAVARGREVGLATDLLARLPLFPEATVREVLDIRRELEPHLKRFRGAMVKFSEAIKTAAWDKDFASDADRVFRREVEPAVQNIEEEMRANRFAPELARKFVDKSLVVTGGSALALTLSNLSLPAIASLAVGGAVGGATAAYDAYKEWSKKDRELRQNSLFFYYKSKRLLAERKYEHVSDAR